ncbi:hypothetical protein [Cerasicoccus arenae]|uniref:Uncharacterized protein n=1 Tax=Cerasicoccus arenae TaxID=424488 RepID=A0A8J3GDH8_9BACT|nr:hypothetical protein [Cerasicoccus arenae]MBK1858020.1 hypothetical protein [Cerasicoccus arenae]GHC06558.1 hypothetical protein GCM10007047_24440 [Cerasicoccus arenae]
MKKNYRSGKSALVPVFVVAGLAILVLVGLMAYRNLAGGVSQPLPVAQFADNPKAFSGNQYELEGRIDTQLGYETGVGRLLLTQDVATNDSVPLFVPYGFEDFSPNPGQIYRFGLRVDERGVLTVESFTKL